MKKIALDTNAYTALLAGDEEVLDALGNAEVIHVPVVVLGELYAGFKGGAREKENRKRLLDFLQKNPVHLLPVTEQTAEVFGEIKHGLQKAGTPIPINDVWIAAQTMETGSFLITRDRHFQKVPGLLLWPQAG